MKSSGMIALFAEPGQSSQHPFTFVVSILVHGVVFTVVSLGFLYGPKVKEPTLGERYTMRLLELHEAEDELRKAEESPEFRAALDDAHRSAAAQKTASALQQVTKQASAPPAKRTPALETLIQPDVPHNLVLPEKIPLPSLLLAAAKDSMAKTIVPPAPQKPATVMAKPVLDLSNRETRIADLKISSSAFSSLTRPVLPSTTTPVVVHGPEPATAVPQTSSNADQQPTSAKVLSVSDLHMKDGVVALPRVNQVASGSGSQGAALGSGMETASVRGLHDSAGAASNSESANKGNGAPGRPGFKHITPPKNGKFGLVVVGASLEEDYPETTGMWNGRLAYTVYIHLGLAKSWILQYALPRSAESAATGSATHLDAPWPTDMVLPNLGPGTMNSDAVIVKGMLTKGGKLENLSVAYPPQFALSKFVLEALQQWEFRPAAVAGQSAAVEVLLIIPDQE